MKKNYNDTLSISGDVADIIARGSSVSLAVCDDKLTADLSSDVTLPDYLPEIRKLLRVNVTPSAPSKFISGSSAQFNGSVEYTVCYVGADGRCYGATFPGEYSFNAPFDGNAEYDMNEGLRGNADICVESVVGKVNSARKLNLRTRLAAKALVLGSNRLSEPSWLSETVHADTQRLVKEISYCKPLMGSNDEIELRDVIDIAAEKAEYVGADCGVFLEEVRAGEGYVDCRGSVRVKYLLRKEGEIAPYVLERRLTLSDIVEIDGIGDGMACTAYCSGCGIDTRAVEDEEGRLECVIHLRLVAHGFGEDKLSYVSDAFSTVYESSCESTSAKLPVMSCCAVKNMTFDSAFPIDKLIKTDVGTVKVADVSVSALAKELTVDGDNLKTAVNGDVTFNIMYSVAASDGGDELYTAEAELPFKVDVGNAAGRIERGSCYACAVDPRVKLTHDSVEVSCEISVSCWGTCDEVAERVTSVDVGDKITGKGSGISVCYPGGGDSLWSVSKKYRVASDRVASENGISADIPADDPRGLYDIKYLIV